MDSFTDNYCKLKQFDNPIMHSYKYEAECVTPFFLTGIVKDAMSGTFFVYVEREYKGGVCR